MGRFSLLKFDWYKHFDLKQQQNDLMCLKCLMWSETFFFWNESVDILYPQLSQIVSAWFWPLGGTKRHNCDWCDQRSATIYYSAPVWFRTFAFWPLGAAKSHPPGLQTERRLSVACCNRELSDVCFVTTRGVPEEWLDQDLELKGLVSKGLDLHGLAGPPGAQR